MPVNNSRNMTQDDAEAIGFSALAFLAEDPSRLAHFLGESGLGPDDLRTGARDHSLLAGVLDYLRGNESLLLVFSSSNRLAPQAIEMAHGLLSGRADEYQSS